MNDNKTIAPVVGGHSGGGRKAAWGVVPKA